MELVELEGGKRLVIPDVVVAASDRRDLVVQYAAAADDAARQAIEAGALAKLAPPDEPEAPAASVARVPKPPVAGPASLGISAEAAQQQAPEQVPQPA